MAKKKAKKAKSQWSCSSCGATTTGWFGRCPSCNEWNTITEQQAAPEADDRVRLSRSVRARVVPSHEALAEATALERLATGIGEFDRVLGGGLVPGSLVLLGGAPGIGKSTLLLQACAGLARKGRSVLYASGEESVGQVGSRAARLGANAPDLLLVAETRIEAILESAREHEPAVIVVDSIQTVFSESHDGLPGNLTQIRSVTAQLLSFAKTQGVPIVVVGHVTKDGQLAGPRTLEHMVDAVLSFEGDDERATRMLRASKNRFGSTQELGVFEMGGEGLLEITNPSEAFMGEKRGSVVGACVTASLEGSRPLLLEVQALLGQSPGGSPRRTCIGADAARLAMLIAVLDRHADLFVVDKDVFVNVAGGIRLREPAADLAVLLAVASSHLRKAVAGRTVVLGEVGLTGELRDVSRLGLRLNEASRLGFERAIVPLRGRRSAELKLPKNLEILEAGGVRHALELAFET
jgi:DNA repair protein RadA/Sms